MRVNPHVSRQVGTSWKTARPQGPRLGQSSKNNNFVGEATHRRSGVLRLQGDALLSICWKIRLHEQQGSCQAAGRQSCRWVPSRQHTLPQPEVGTAAPEPDIELLSVGACACALRAPRRHAPHDQQWRGARPSKGRWKQQIRKLLGHEDPILGPKRQQVGGRKPGSAVSWLRI